MLQIINYLCKTFKKELNLEAAFKGKRQNENETFENMFEYRQPQTGDNLALYAARCGNVDLIEAIHEHAGSAYFSRMVNNDGKNALHEVKTI